MIHLPDRIYHLVQFLKKKKKRNVLSPIKKIRITFKSWTFLLLWATKGKVHFKLFYSRKGKERINFKIKNSECPPKLSKSNLRT